MVMLGTQKLQYQATLTNKNKIPEIFFRIRFHNSTERKPQILGFLFFSLVSVSVRMVPQDHNIMSYIAPGLIPRYGLLSEGCESRVGFQGQHMLRSEICSLQR